MDRKAYAVIGAHYGDEGKGQVTAWLCRMATGYRVLNVLTNGGCQRGHTVHITNDRDFRHVFKHFGSGTPYGADTHFGPEFILNPMQFVLEYKELADAGFEPVCTCGPFNRVQLPVDAAINQYLETERARNGRRHGSVGFGINETVLRYERGIGMSAIQMITLAEEDASSLEKHISELSEEYARSRISEELGEGSAYDEFMERYDAYMCEGTVRHYVDDLRSMFDKVSLSSPYDVASSHGCFVFENGQGLKIGQQESRSLLNCTPSDTGAFPVLRCMYDLKLIGNGANDFTRIDELYPVYVSRTYMTRHGEGPFSDDESDVPPFGENPDETNVPNDFQGSIRYAELSGRSDFDEVYRDVARFDATCGEECTVHARIVATHAGFDARSALNKFPHEPDAVFPTDQPDAVMYRYM